MTEDFTPNFKDNQGDCGCGCGLFGTLNKRGCVSRRCKCVSCRNKNNRSRGMSSQRKFQKVAGIKQARNRSGNGNEENWRDYWRWEHKDGAQVRPVATAYLKCMEQSEASGRPIGDNRPFALGVTVNGLRLVVVKAEDWAQHVAPFYEDGDAA